MLLPDFHLSGHADFLYPLLSPRQAYFLCCALFLFLIWKIGIGARMKK